MPTTPRVPSILLPRRREKNTWRWATGSIAAHVVVILALVIDWSGPAALPDIRTPGGEGPVGGGGGGGAERIEYINLPAWQAPAEEQHEEQVVVRPEEIVIPQPEIVKVNLETPTFDLPKTTNASDQDVLGRGPGSGGGPGAGTGSGGGIGSGQGTGVGTHTGPGTGGDGGDVFPPTPRYVQLPLDDRPPSVKGKRFTAHFVVTKEGRVESVEISPTIRDTDYRRRLIRMLSEWSFAPAITRDGVAVRADAIVPFTL